MLSLAAFAALSLSLLERSRIGSLVERGRGHVSRMMRFQHAEWEEVGSTNLSFRVTKELLESVSQLKAGQEMLKIDLTELEQKLSTIPWIESLQIQKKLPSTIHVRYTTHHARAIGVRQGKPWLMSTSGKWIALLVPGAPTLDLPVLALSSGATSEEIVAQVELLDALEAALGSQLVQVHEVSSTGLLGKTTSLIELQYSSRSHKVKLITTPRPNTESLNRLRYVVQYLIKNNILVSSIDLRLGKKVVVNLGKRP